MMIKIINFSGMPEKYNKINNILSRSAQPKKDDFVWLKERGITDIIDLKTGFEKNFLNFKEEEATENLKLNYHQLKFNAIHPKEETVDEFFKIIKQVEKNKGKAHIHCLQGSDRTGMLAFIYKTLSGIGDIDSNKEEWISLGYNRTLFPNLIEFATKYIKKKQQG